MVLQPNNRKGAALDTSRWANLSLLYKLLLIVDPVRLMTRRCRQIVSVAAVWGDSDANPDGFSPVFDRIA